MTQTIDSLNRQLRISAVIRGIVLGVIVLSLSIFSYYFITDLTKTNWLIVTGPYLFAVIIPILVTVFFCLNIRKNLGGYWTFKQAVTGTFIMFLISYAILTIGRDIIFSRLIERDMAQKTEAVMLNVRAQSLKLAGANKKEVDAQVVELRKEFEVGKNIGPTDILQSYIINIIMLFVLSIIFGAMFKKERPYTINVNTNVTD